MAALNPPPPRRAWLRPLIVGGICLVIGSLLAVLGIFSWPHTFALLAIIVALDHLVAQGRDNAPKPWPNPPLRFRRGARSDVATLAWATVDRNGDVTERAMQRVRELAQAELAERGVAWNGQRGEPMTPAPLAQQLIGSAAVTTLTTNNQVRPRALENVVTRLEQLRSSQ